MTFPLGEAGIVHRWAERSSTPIPISTPGGSSRWSEPYGTGLFRRTRRRRRGGVGYAERARRPRGASTSRPPAALYPAVWDVDDTFGELHGEAATYLTPRTTFGPTLALRAGAKKVWGDFPVLRVGLRGRRAPPCGDSASSAIAGDAALYGNAELRARARPVLHRPAGRLRGLRPGRCRPGLSGGRVLRPGTPASAAGCGSPSSSPPTPCRSRWRGVTAGRPSTCGRASVIDHCPRRLVSATR